MGLTTAMYTGLSGMNVNQARISTIGHNIANVNTTAFKNSRTLFQTQLSQTLSLGTRPSATSGGTNPTQIGLGAAVGTTQRDMSAGSLETTGIASDLAINGRGFFVLRDGNGRQMYTRDGAFNVDSQNRLVNADGYIIQGFGVDDGFNIVPGELTDITIPLGASASANATSTFFMMGELNSGGTIATHGSTHVSQAMVSGGGAAATGATQLTDLRSADDPGTVLFAAGDTLTISGVSKGSRQLAPRTFTVGTDGSTLEDLANWLTGAMGINTNADVPGNPGITIEGGTLVIRGNAGEENGFEISGNEFLSSNADVSLPFQFTGTEEANGASAYTSFTGYDSLGTPVSVNATFVLEETPDTGPVWRYYLESADASGESRVLGTGTAAFDTQGNFVSATGNQFTLDRSGTGAASPMSFALDFSSVYALATGSEPTIMSFEQDGYPPGTLIGFSVGQDGVINGTFSNGLTQRLGQVAVATFANDEGLVAESDNLYSVGPNSGNAMVGTPGQLAAGSLMSGALELSNVDLSREFIGLVTSSTGFQASSRVISVSSDLLNQLLLIVR